MVWQRNGTPDTLTVAGDVNEVTDLSGLKTNFMLNHQLNSGQLITGLRINNVSATDYARRFSTNGGTDGTDTNSNQFSAMTTGVDSFDEFCVGYVNGVSSQEKLGLVWVMGRGTAGAANAPTRRENANKWADTSNTVNELNVVNTGTGDLAIDTNLSVLGDVVPPPAAVGGWVELGRTTLGSSNATIDVTSLSDKRYLMVLCSSTGVSAGANTGTQLNADIGNNYARRGSNNGSSDSADTSFNDMEAGATSTEPYFQIGYLSNFATKEKLLISHLVAQTTAGGGTAPFRNESVGKHAQTTNPVSSYQWITSAAATFDTGSECVVLGWDPTDTHTTNFWEEIFSEKLTSNLQEFDTGTITAKKYLWLQFYQVGHTGNSILTFNADTGTNYARRHEINGAVDATVTSQTGLVNVLTGGTGDNQTLTNMFIINNSADEKLMIFSTTFDTASGAATAPMKILGVCKWANTSAQITRIQVDDNTGTGFNAPSFLKIWGAD